MLSSHVRPIAVLKLENDVSPWSSFTAVLSLLSNGPAGAILTLMVSQPHTHTLPKHDLLLLLLVCCCLWLRSVCHKTRALVLMYGVKLGDSECPWASF